jgi:hypothetical protein
MGPSFSWLLLLILSPTYQLLQAKWPPSYPLSYSSSLCSWRTWLHNASWWNGLAFSDCAVSVDIYLFVTYSLHTLCTKLKLYVFLTSVYTASACPAWSVGTRVPPAALAPLAGRVGTLFPAGPLGRLAARPWATSLGRRPLHRNHRHKPLGTHGHPA